MKKAIWSVVLVLSLALGSKASPPTPPAGTSWTESFDDEFTSDTSLNPALWEPNEFGTSGDQSGDSMLYNNTLSNGTSPNIAFSSSGLQLTAIYEGTPTATPWSSGLISTYANFNQAFGYFEISAQVPGSPGAWPAFWLLEGDQEGDYNWPPELDVMECPVNSGNTPPTIDYMTQHWSLTSYPLDAGTDSNAAGGGSFQFSLDLSQAFHTYGLDWEPDQTTWYVDGVPYASQNGRIPYLRAMHMLLNLAVGGWGGSTTSTESMYYNVSYCRAYTRSLPASWSSCDIGNPMSAGRTYASTSGLFNVYGGGTGIGGASDQFQFAYQILNGNGTIIARVKNEVGTNSINVASNPNALAGLMIRNSLSASDSYAFMALEPVVSGTAGGNVFSARTTSGGTATQTVAGNGQNVPSWLMLVRNGTTLSGYSSPDGVNWTLNGTATMSMNTAVYAGFAVTSSGTAQKATAQFDNISMPGGSSGHNGDPFVTVQPTIGTALNNSYTGSYGIEFTVGASPITVTQLGRWVVSGNTQTHTVKLSTQSGDVPGGSVSINTAGATPGQYLYATLPVPVTLSANTTYYLVSHETAGGDKKYGNIQVVTTGAASIVSAAYSSNDTYPWSPVTNQGANYEQGPVNFIAEGSPAVNSAPVASGTMGSAFNYQIAASNSPTSYAATGLPAGLTLNNSSGAITGTPTTVGTSNIMLSATNAGGTGAAMLTLTVGSTYLTGETVGNLDNDFTGWVGYKFTVGSSPISVSSLGRWVVSSDTSTHTLELVEASNNAVLGSVSVNTSGATAGTFLYANLETPVTLSANTTYYVVSSETNGGDQWYNENKLTVTSAAVFNEGVYSSSGTTWDTTEYAYGPLNFQYSTLSAPAITSALSASGTVGSAFSYQITATNGPTSYSATGLPAGLTVNTSTGAITGTPSAVGTSSVTLSATNASGIGTATLTLTVGNGLGAPYVIGETLGNLDNDFTGWVGYEFTVGNSPITVNSLGRWVVSGNTGTHTLELVQASNNAVLGSVSVNTSGAAAGSFEYVALGTPVTLSANTAYYVVSSETNGGDKWYNENQLGTTYAAVFNEEVHGTTGTSWTFTGGGIAYGPLNFQYVTP